MFNWFWEFLYGLIKVPLFCIDIIIMIARKLCGIDPVQIEREVNGEIVMEDVDILTYFMQGETIVNAFGYVCLFGFVLLFLFTAFRIIRDQVNFYEKKSPIRTCLDSAKIILIFLLVPAIMIVGTAFVSTLMRGIYDATANGNSGLGGSMFVIFAEEAYTGPAEDKQAVLDAFRTCSLEDYINGVSEFSYYNTDKVSEYFKLSKMNFFLGLVGSLSVVVLLGLTMLSFVERIISLVLMFVIAPLPMSASPLDDGERFKIWREQTINKFLTAYGGILALNIFALMLPMIAKINFFPATSDNTGIVSVINGISRLLFIIGGALACWRGMALIGNLVNRGAGSQDLADQSHLLTGMASAGHVASGVVKGALGFVGGAAKGSFNKGRSWLQAADVPTSVAEGIRQHTQMKKDRESEERRAAANRFDGKVDRGGAQGAANLQAAMQGKTDGGSAKNDSNKPATAPNAAKSPANNDKNTEMNKNAQTEIKNALQNKKSDDANTKSDDNKDSTKK